MQLHAIGFAIKASVFLDIDRNIVSIHMGESRNTAKTD